MISQFTLTSERFLSVVTRIRFLCSMQANVTNQGSGGLERFVTLVTVVMFLTAMCSLV